MIAGTGWFSPTFETERPFRLSASGEAGAQRAMPVPTLRGSHLASSPILFTNANDPGCTPGRSDDRREAPRDVYARS